MPQDRHPAEGRPQGPRRRSPRDQEQRADASPAARRQADDARQRAEEIVRTSNIPLNLALQVARGQRTLNDVVMQLAREAEVERLMARHELNRALAMQVARGEVKLEEVLRKVRQQAYLAGTRDRSALTDALQQGAALALAVHGGKILRGRVTAVEVYDVLFAPEGEAEVRLPKVQIKYAYDPAQYKQVRKQLHMDPARKGSREPILRPQDRYGCSDKRLFRYMDTGAVVVATTLEGEVFRGKVSWMSRWEFCLKLERSEASVVIWRHALADLAEVR